MKQRKIIDDRGQEIDAAVTHEGYTPPEALGRGALLFLRDGAFEVVGIDLVAGVETLKVRHRSDHVWNTLRRDHGRPERPKSPLLDISGFTDHPMNSATEQRTTSNDAVQKLAKSIQ
jgi:hypothetical protein